MGKQGIAGIVIIVALGLLAYSAGLFANSPGEISTPSRGDPRSSREARLEIAGFEGQGVDLGSHLWNTIVPFDLKFVNHSAASITVKTVKTSCNCMLMEAALFAGRTVGPGESLVLPGTLDTGKYPGPLVRTITLYDDAGGEWTAALDVDVFGTWSISVERMDFGQFLDGTSGVEYLEQSFTFTSDTDELLAVPESAVPWVECFVATRSENSKEILVRIPVEELAAGVNTTEIVVRTTSDVRPDFVVPVRVEAVPALVVAPPSVFLVGQEARRVRVFDRDGVGAKVVRAQSSHEGLSVRIIDANEIEIRNTSKQRLTEAVTVHVEDAQGRMVEIRVSAF